MILACPSCRTRFQVDEAALRQPGGRLVRCAQCGHSWRHVAEPAAPLRAEPAEPQPRSEPAVPPLRSEPAAPRPAPRPAPVALAAGERAPQPVPPVRRHGSWVAFAVAFGLVVIAVAALFAVVERAAIVARYPSAADFYAVIGLPVEQPGAVLKIDNIKPVRTADGLIIEGEIANHGATAHDLPELRVALQDGAEREVQFKVVPPPQPRLGPGEIAHFKTPFQHPADVAKNVVVTFAER